MAAWLFFALLAPFLFGIANVFDKLLRGKHLGTFTMSVFYGISAFWILPLVPLLGFSSTAFVAVAGIIAGALFFFAGFPYITALASEEASRVVPLWALEAPLTLILAFAFLNERLVASDYLGFVLVVAGAFLVSAKNLASLADALRPSKAFFLMLLASFLTAGGIVISKWLYSQTSFWSVQILLSFGAGLSAVLMLLMLAKERAGFFGELRQLGKDGVAKLGARQLAFIFGGIVFSLAIMTGSASLTAALVQLSAFYVFIIATFMSRFVPHILEEEIDKKALLTKAAAIVIIIAGVFAVNL